MDKENIKLDCNSNNSDQNTQDPVSDQLFNQLEVLNEKYEEIKEDINDTSNRLTKLQKEKDVIEINIKEVKSKLSKNHLNSKVPKRHFSADLKNKAIDALVIESKGLSEVSKLFGISVSHLKRLRKTKQEELGNPAQSKARKSKLKEENIVKILCYVDENNYFKINQLMDYIIDQNIGIGETSIRSLLSTTEITWKNNFHIPDSWNSEEIKNARYEYATDIAIVNKEKVYVKELHFNLDLKPSKPTTKDAQPQFLSIAPRSIYVSLFIALGKGGIVYHEIYNENGLEKRRIDAKVFEQFMTNLNTICNNTLFILGELPAYKVGTDLENKFKEKDNLYKFIPKYSPFINPIEFAFNDLRIDVKKIAPLSHGFLVTCVKKAIKKVNTQSNAQKWFDQAKKYSQPCIKNHTFTGFILHPDLP